MSYEQVKDLRPADFKRYCGVEPETFRRMVELVSQRLTKERRKTGRPPKLSVEDQVLLTLEYWREYRTLFHLATSWGLHESNVCRVIRRVEDILTKSRAFKLPGKKVLRPADHEIEFAVGDARRVPEKKAAGLLQRQKEAAHAEEPSRRGWAHPASPMYGPLAWPRP
jgi:hypothetical protein